MSNTPNHLKTWRGNKSVRLANFDYAQHVPYHIIIRAITGTRPFIRPDLAKTTCTTLQTLCDNVQAYLAAYCLMADHLHILMSPDLSGLSVGELIGRFKSLSTRNAWTLNVHGKLWQARFYDHILRKDEDIKVVARYIYENPDRKGILADYEYRWLDSKLAT